MRILAAYDVFSACAWYRLAIPLHAASLAGCEVRLRQASVSASDLAWCDVFVVQRGWHPNMLRAVTDARILGKRVVYDLDDDLWTVGPRNSSAAFWKAHREDAERVIGACHAVTVTGPALASTLSRHHDHVSIVPNALPPDFTRTSRPHDGLVIGWAGSSSHAEDLEMVAESVAGFLGPDVRLETAGGCAVTHEHAVSLKAVPIERYHELLSRFDIGLAPLCDSRFNRAKSDLKLIEYSAVGVPWIASPVGPYKPHKGCGAGLLASTPTEWKRHLAFLMEHPEARRQMGERGFEWARRIDTTLPAWLAVWEGSRGHRRDRGRASLAAS